MKLLEFTQVDVFTSRKLEGNSLAVFHDGRGLSMARMQAIAREMNLAETTFLLPASRQADARVRIFTVKEELPFAGHPTLGTAFVLATSLPRKREIRLQTKVGVILVTITKSPGQAFLEMRQKDPVFGSRVSNPKRLSAALGIGASELDWRYRPQMVSTGLPFLIIPLRRSRSLARLAPTKALTPMVRRMGAHFPYYLVTGEPKIEGADVRPDL